MQQHLITPNDVKKNTREVAKLVSENKILIYIEESENLDIKPALGDSLFLDVISDPEKYSDLLDGCEYETRNGNKRVFLGLKKSICYYSYARLMKNGDYNVNRFGTSNKDSEYSSNTDYKEKVIAYNDAFDVADRYLKECVLYLNENKDRYPLYRGKGGLRSNRTIYRVLGD